jgi:hypothetical protein
MAFLYTKVTKIMITTKRIFILCFLLVFFIKSLSSQDIFSAVMKGDLDKTEILLEEHPEWINIKSWGGWTPLHRAAQFGYVDIIDFLISKGSNLEAKTSLGMTPLYAAIIGQKSDVVKQLIDKGANIFAIRNDGETMLHIAAAMGQRDIVELLISEGLNVDMTRRYGITPLHLASVFGHKTTVETLITNGAKIDQKNDNGSTALHLAAAADETQIVAILKEKGASEAPEKYVRITGDYLGQKKPGSTPVLFAPGILFITHRPHGCITFSPDGKEIYWVGALTFGANQKIWMMNKVKDHWSPPRVVPLEATYKYGGPAVSPDGKRFFFVVHKTSGSNGQKINRDIWYQEKNASGWGEVINPGTPLNSDKSETGPSVSRKGNIYFYSFDIEGGFGSVDIYRSMLTKNGYEKPENIGDSVNTKFTETLPYIAPDESYLLFSSMRPEGYGDYDLYVSYQKKNGTWTKAKNMGKTINTSSAEIAPAVSPDGKYLFFMSRRNGIGEFFWVDAKIISQIKPMELK